MNEFIDTLLTTVREMDPVTRTLIAMLGMFLETSVLVGMVVPGDSIALIASAGVTSAPQFVWLLIALVVGALLGESLGFFIGRFFGAKLRASRIGKRIGEKNWMLAEMYLGDRGGVAVFVSRFLPILHSLVPLSAGMAKMRFRTFLAWTIPASIIWATLYVSFGVFAAVSYDQLSGMIKGAGYVVIGLVLTFVFVMWLLKRRLFRTEMAQHQVNVESAAHDENNPVPPTERNTLGE